MFDAGKTRMIGVPYGKKNYDDLLSRFYLIPERNGQTDGQTDIFSISISRVSMLTRDKNCHETNHYELVDVNAETVTFFKFSGKFVLYGPSFYHQSAYYEAMHLQ